MRVRLAADFAHLFDVKAGAGAAPAALSRAERGWSFSGSTAAFSTATAIVVEPEPDEVELATATFVWHLDIPARSEVVVCLTAEPSTEGQLAGLAFPCGEVPADAVPMRRQTEWMATVPTAMSIDPRISTVLDQALADIAALRIIDKDHLDRFVIAAGAPWFMTLFGRDSLIASWMTLPFDAGLAVGVLLSLAELQGRVDDPRSEEQPGKIIHELRRHGGGGPFASRERYYGTVDATPLFVMLAAEAWRWGALSADDLTRLAPHVDAALDWITGWGDADGDGFVDYRRRDETGLGNQGWKDSWDGITFADGRLPTAPIALVEVQGYTYAALLGAADLAPSMGLRHEPGVLRKRADRLRSAFNDTFWDPQGWYALGLDRDGRRIDSLTTNPGHALWTGICDPTLAERYLDRMMEPDLWSGWGLRTLATTMHAYDPLSYHNGSIWPHDTAICAAGAARYGRWDIVDRIVDGAFDAAVHFEGRPPELFAGISRESVPLPVSYPASCSPQAWSSASVLSLIRSWLDLGPSVDREELRIHRTELGGLPDLTLERIAFRGSLSRVSVGGGVGEVRSIRPVHEGVAIG
jgi:glycogen debranching enzyme